MALHVAKSVLLATSTTFLLSSMNKAKMRSVDQRPWSSRKELDLRAA